MTRIRVLVTSLLLLASASWAQPAGAAEERAPAWRFWEMTRQTSGPTQIFPVISAVFHESRVVLAATLLHREGRSVSIVPGGSMFSDEGKTAPSGYAAGTSLRCSASGCSASPARGFDLLGVVYKDRGANDRSANTVALAAYGVDIQVSAKEPGWVLHEVHRRASTVWSTDGGDASGVHSQHGGIELFQSAALPGGSRGSLAWGALPCTSIDVISSGIGTGTLTGGRTPVSATCPTSPGSLLSIATGPTTWRLTGPVAGTTATLNSDPGPVRLLVLSF